LYNSFSLHILLFMCDALFTRKAVISFMHHKNYNIVGHRCLWLSRTTSRSISRYFERDLELMRKQLDFFFYILVPVLDFIYTICRF